MVRPEDYGIELCGGVRPLEPPFLKASPTTSGSEHRGIIALTDRVSCWWMANAEPI